MTEKAPILPTAVSHNALPNISSAAAAVGGQEETHEVLQSATRMGTFFPPSDLKLQPASEEQHLFS